MKLTRIFAGAFSVIITTASHAQTPQSPVNAKSTAVPASVTHDKSLPAPTIVPKRPSEETGKAASPAPRTAANGGGDGKVWVNTKSNVYHCAGTKYYGKTKVGEYMTEADAKAKGNHADHQKACH